jgi:hypothetical protein
VRFALRPFVTMSLLGASAMMGDIWSTGAFSLESPLKDLLDSGSYTMEQLLAEDELLQELRGVHPKLISFFSTPEAVTKLVDYIMLSPDSPVPTEDLTEAIESHSQEAQLNIEDSPNASPDLAYAEDCNIAENDQTKEKKRPGEWMMEHATESFDDEPETTAVDDKSKHPERDPEMLHIRFPFVACEIICCEVPAILDTFVQSNVPSSYTTAWSAPSATTPLPHPEQIVERNGEEVEIVELRPTRILDRLFDVLFKTPRGALDDYRAGYFDKVLSVLFRTRPAEMTTFVNEGGFHGKLELMKSMMKHLYAHSVMQIVQRLLLPQRPRPQISEDEIDDDDDIQEGLLVEGLEQVGEEDGGIRCDWSQTGEALEMLLACLIHPQIADQNDTTVDSSAYAEHRLDLSLHASEVLITVIQNSMLSSETMLRLTSYESLEQLLLAATTVPEGTSFSPHESLLTSSMSVLESLILQLGGYGAVGTMSLLPPAEESIESVPSDAKVSPEDEDSLMSPESNGMVGSNHLIADLSAFLALLPRLLKGMSSLLRHPAAKGWTSMMQYSMTEPQQLLGTSRLRIIRVLEALVLLGDPEVDARLTQSDCLKVSLDLFWEFQWCSMLHQSVANMLVHVFEGRNGRVEMQEYFVVNCNLLERLMGSFETRVATPRLENVVSNILDESITVSSSLNGERGSLDKLPVSEDDIEAALEQEEEDAATRQSSNSDNSPSMAFANDELIMGEPPKIVDQTGLRETSTIGGHASSQSFRYGYMGHVIIICQALVHACSNEVDEEDATNEDPDNVSITQDSLLLAEFVNSHPLSDMWDDFITSTLVTETATQSMPLGGFPANGIDPLHSHRPGMPDDGDDDDGSRPLPPRGMLGGGEAIDMDDNDLDIAASMMAGLGLGPPIPTDDGSGSEGDDSDVFSGSGDSEKSYNSGETNNVGGGYVFDDPLGKTGGLGIELGKLTQYNSENGSNEIVPRPTDDDDDVDEQNDSSDEETGDRTDRTSKVQIMDLFAGNFNECFGEPTVEAVPEANASFSADFANFDAAFAEADIESTTGGTVTDDVFGEFSSEPAFADSKDHSESESSSRNSEIEEIFGKGDHVAILEESLATELVPQSKKLSSPEQETEVDREDGDDDYSHRDPGIIGRADPAIEIESPVNELSISLSGNFRDGAASNELALEKNHEADAQTRDEIQPSICPKVVEPVPSNDQ